MGQFLPADSKAPSPETTPLPEEVYGSEAGPGKTAAERKLIWKLDLFILSWACFGYFLRLLDTSNMTNAYVSGMREDLNLTGNQFNLFTTFWTCGYIVGQIPSQLVITKIRPSIWIPGAEILWAVFTFSFAAMHSEKQIYAVRFLIGLAESPFYVGAITLLGNWYTPEELGKRATIFYSASFAANMFSGYLQAGVYNGMNNLHGIAGWRWLFIMCGVISVPGALWGFFAVPDSPYNTRAKWLTPAEVELAKARMIREDRRPFHGVSWDVVKKLVTFHQFWPMVIAYICFCLDTYYLTFFAIWLKSLGTYSVAQINVIPTGAAAIGLVSTILWGYLSDRLRARLPVAALITLVNVVGSLVLAIAPSRAGIFFGYFVNAATYAYGPIVLVGSPPSLPPLFSGN
ncbi:hypothetical protein SLS56_004464 [Neofusicoccum ribis]|uniref:Major facilitator superfamily (MFS) profile domain-containing protein n=1 Tax=Neofusicoccum ribis TaxID=45134 RepID=A0ABR3SX42_9PEZI